MTADDHALNPVDQPREPPSSESGCIGNYSDAVQIKESAGQMNPVPESLVTNQGVCGCGASENSTISGVHTLG